jgi:hypothetical protein
MASIEGDAGASTIKISPPYGVWGDTDVGEAVTGTANTGIGVAGRTLAGYQAVYGGNSKPGTPPASDLQPPILGGIGVRGVNPKYAGIGVRGEAGDQGIGVIGTCDTGVGLQGETRSGTGVYGNASTEGTGVTGQSVSGTGVAAISSSGTALSASSAIGVGVYGASAPGANNFGVVGKGQNAGVVAFNHYNQHSAYLASAFGAAWFVGDVYVNGNLSKSGGGFLIDHPQDPANRLLAHAFVESSERRNLYDGVAVLDDNGRATVQLPNWFESLNADVRYQLTPLGTPAPNLHISEELKDRRFSIAGGVSGMKVCWQLTGVRQDPWALANPLTVEADKPDQEKGTYLHPEPHGHDSQRSLSLRRHDTAP